MRQGIVVTCFLGLFVAGAMFFTGDASLFAMPKAPVQAVAAAIAEAAPRAAEPAPRIERRDAPSAAADGTVGLLHWLSAGFGQLNFGKVHDTGRGLTIVAQHTSTTVEE